MCFAALGLMMLICWTGPEAAPEPAIGGTLPGFTRGELQRFIVGALAFKQLHTPKTGLGPIFNEASCATCHSDPIAGGSSDRIELRFGRQGDGFDPLEALGGSLLQDQAIDPACLERVPLEANIVAGRLTTPLFGSGLIDAIPDQAIVDGELEDDPDGVRGRAAVVFDVATQELRVGRFGWKCQVATLKTFAADAYVNEIGVTSGLFPHENAPNGDQVLLAQFDKRADPEDPNNIVVQRFVDYMQLLGAPRPGALSPLFVQGKQLFVSIGCAKCHTPRMMTGDSPIAALAHRNVDLYSDLLLHDMGELGDGIEQADAGATEMRTAPLWGIRFRELLLHDGRTDSIHEAILEHAGEATAVRDRYAQLPAKQRDALLRFVNSL